MIKKKRRKKRYIKKSRYVDLTEDLVFKYFFSSNKAVLAFLIESFLPIKAEVKGLLLLDTSRAPTSPARKYVILDLVVLLKSGIIVHIEMHKNRSKHLPKRTTYYWSCLYSENLKKGESYDKLKPIYSLVFTNFGVFGKKIKDFIHPYSVRSDIEPHEVLDDDLNIVFVEAHKGQDAEAIDVRKKWCYIFIHSANLTDSERKQLAKHKRFKMVLEHFDEVSKNKKLSYEALSRDVSLKMWKMERKSILKEGIAKGMRKGAAKGKAEGMKKGIAKGKAEGKKQNQKEIALRMLETGFTSAEVSKATGLSEQEIARFNQSGLTSPDD